MTPLRSPNLGATYKVRTSPGRLVVTIPGLGALEFTIDDCKHDMHSLEVIAQEVANMAEAVYAKGWNDAIRGRPKKEEE